MRDSFARFKVLVESVASAIGMDLKDSSDRRYLLTNGADQFLMEVDYYCKRVTIEAAGHPVLLNGRLVRIGCRNISVSMERDVIDIVRDITRRFLPEYRACLDRAKATCAEQNKRLKPGVDLIQKTAARFGVNHSHCYLGATCSEGELSLHVYDDLTCTIELSELQPDVAERILSLLTLPTVSNIIKEPS